MSERPISFCMVTTFYPPYHFGGDAMYVYRLSNELARKGHRVVVAHCVDAYRMLGGIEPTGSYSNHPNVQVHPLESGSGSVSPLVTYLTGQPGLKKHSLDEIFREQFDVVHFHNISLIGGPGVLRYGVGLKLYTMHEHWLICPMHVLWKNKREPCVTPECLKCTLSFRRPPQLWRYTGLLARQLEQVDLFLSPSRFTENQHRQRGFGRPIRVLPHFLPFSSLQAPGAKRTPLAADGRPYFLFVGRLERLKGLHTLIGQFREYRAADLLIAGDGEEASRLRKQAEGLSHVRFLGRVHPTALPELYSGAIATIVPSVGYETFGMITLESFAQKTPVIVRDLGGLPEVVRESGGGLVYRLDNELVPLMESLRTNPALRCELGQRGFTAYKRNWSEEPHLAAYFAAIAEARALRSRTAARDRDLNDGRTRLHG